MCEKNNIAKKFTSIAIQWGVATNFGELRDSDFWYYEYEKLIPELEQDLSITTRALNTLIKSNEMSVRYLAAITLKKNVKLTFLPTYWSSTIFPMIQIPDQLEHWQM